MTGKTVFIISKDPGVRDSLAELVASVDLPTAKLSSVEAWLETAEPEAQGCLVLDAGAELVEPERRARFASVCARIPVLLLIDRGDVPTAVRAIKHGAVEVLQKPIRDSNLLACIKWVVTEKSDVGVSC